MARTKGRFNAVGHAEPAAVQAPARIFHTALYARLSVENAERKSNSIESQLDIMKAFVKRHPELSDYHEYTDSGFSGTSFERPAFSQMMDDVRNGRVNCILVKDLSRFGRDYLETTNYIEVILPFLGVRFISVNDHFDTDAPNSGNKTLEVALKNLVNDMYAKDISKRLAVSRQQDMERGKFVGAAAPYGYVVDPDDPLRRFLIDEPAAQVVRDIYGMAAEGMPLLKISRCLQERNLSIPRQYFRTGHLYQEEGDPVKAWHAWTISTILKNPAYTGDLAQGKCRERLCDGEKSHFTEKDEWIVIKDAHPAIIDREMYEKVQGIFEKKVKDSTFSSGRGKDIPITEDRYASLLFCGVCGKRILRKSMISEKHGIRHRNNYYRCNNNFDKSTPEHGCPSIRENKLDRIVFEAVKAQAAAVADKKDAEAVCDEAFREKLKNLGSAVKKAEISIAREEYKGSRNYEDYVTGVISRDQLTALQAESDEKIKRLKGALETAQEQYKARERELDAVRKMVESVLGMKDQGDITREFLQLMVERIEFFPDAHLEIKWKFSEWFGDDYEVNARRVRSR